MANGAVYAIGAGVLGALGLAWWSKRKAEATGKTGCEVACIVAAKASGTTGDLDALCRGACGIIKATNADATITTAIGGLKSLITGESGPVCQDGYIPAYDNRTNVEGRTSVETFAKDFGPLNHTCVPAPTEIPPVVPVPTPIGMTGTTSTRGPRGGITVT